MTVQKSKEIVDYCEIYNDSYVRISINPELFYKTFYEIFIKKSPKIREAFSVIDKQKQILMLRDSMSFMLLFSAFKRTDDYLLKLVDLHRNKLNIETELFDLWMDSLIDTLKVLDPRFNKDIELAWRITLAPSIEFMKHYTD